MVGTTEFMAPEVVAGTGHDTDAVPLPSLRDVVLSPACSTLSIQCPMPCGKPCPDQSYAHERSLWRSPPAHTPCYCVVHLELLFLIAV